MHNFWFLSSVISVACHIILSFVNNVNEPYTFSYMHNWTVGPVGTAESTRKAFKFYVFVMGVYCVINVGRVFFDKFSRKLNSIIPEIAFCHWIFLWQLVNNIISSCALVLFKPMWPYCLIFLGSRTLLGSVQGLLMDLHLGIISEMLRGTYGMLKINSGLAVCKTYTLPALLTCQTYSASLIASYHHFLP